MSRDVMDGNAALGSLLVAGKVAKAGKGVLSRLSDLSGSEPRRTPRRTDAGDGYLAQRWSANGLASEVARRQQGVRVPLQSSRQSVQMTGQLSAINRHCGRAIPPRLAR